MWGDGERHSHGIMWRSDAWIRGSRGWWRLHLAGYSCICCSVLDTRIMAGDSRDTWRIHYTLPAYRGSEKHFREEWGVIVWVVWVAAWWQGPLPGILWLGSWQPSVQSPHILQIEFQAFGSREMSIASQDVLSLLSTSLYFLTCSYSL